LSATLTEAVRAPVAVGVKVTEIVQLAPAASVAGQVLVCPKSPAFAPVTEMAVIVSPAVPVFVSVAVWAAPEVPTRVLPNVSAPGDSDTLGAGPVAV
jgi:hypothetical protein